MIETRVQSRPQDVLAHPVSPLRNALSHCVGDRRNLSQSSGACTHVVAATRSFTLRVKGSYLPYQNGLGSPISLALPR
jgi:hypothetical protein